MMHQMSQVKSVLEGDSCLVLLLSDKQDDFSSHSQLLSSSLLGGKSLKDQLDECSDALGWRRRRDPLRSQQPTQDIGQQGTDQQTPAQFRVVALDHPMLARTLQDRFEKSSPLLGDGLSEEGAQLRKTGQFSNQQAHQPDIGRMHDVLDRLLGPECQRLFEHGKVLHWPLAQGKQYMVGQMADGELL